MRVLIAGCGYLGTALGRSLIAQGHHVAALRRSAAALAELEAQGFEPIEADLARPETLGEVRRDWTAVVQCTAPSRAEADTYETAYRQSVRTLLGWVDRALLGRFVFISSTSVYGQGDGAWVTEEMPAEPASESAQVLRRAEQEVLDAVGVGLRGTVLRVSGIYGPGRNRLAALRRGEGIPGDRAHYVNMVHREDVVSAVTTVLGNAASGALYNVSDDTPVVRGEFLGWIAGQLGVEAPAPAPFRTVAGSRLGGHKRISNARLRRELAWTPKHPSFREGYAALLRDGE